MTESAEGMSGLQAHSQVPNSQVFSQVLGNPVDTSYNNTDTFLQLFNITEANARDMVAGEEKWEFVVKSLMSVGEEISILRKENSDLKNSLHSAKGQIIKLERKVEQQQKKLADVEWSVLQRNIVMYNIDKSQSEECVQTVHNVLTNHFKLCHVDFRSQDNLSGSIEIDTASRIGRQIGQRGRPILVKFTTHKGKDVVMKKIRSERISGLIKVSDQYLATMKEKRMAQIDELKHTRDMYKDSGKK